MSKRNTIKGREKVNISIEIETEKYSRSAEEIRASKVDTKKKTAAHIKLWEEEG